MLVLRSPILWLLPKRRPNFLARSLILLWRMPPINKGCLEHGESDPNGDKCKTLRDLECHPGHARAKLDNPVLGWLDSMENVKFSDTYAYFPCTCGTKALNAYLKSRYKVEPGYDPSEYTHEAPQPFFLDEDALEEDRQHKAKDEAYLGPIPDFTELTKYTLGFRMPQGFLQIEHEALPPRREHGYLHRPFTDHCMGCFPTGEHNDDCSEYNAHNAVRAIKYDSSREREYEAVHTKWDRAQFGRIRNAEEHKKIGVLNAQHYASVSWYYGGWNPKVTV
ncbi:hypothetical protein BU25DRAFT_233951 [Macroventuria anomochaeta]|uniref:Uncharacterized protein n=1 Tax=Macroventuria anomochaeta TaxID=301207 RepID=A0ACB6RI32_9PLEO|nr:uncharacterized protein BU25DRAFT_233951 [Macroventuria anomochaeta]KAF2621570.1 hypothetical protein BU25DRAFT_233951 [Macroventuria anomochaeta]